MRYGHTAPRPPAWGFSVAASILALPRGTKRLIMAIADAVAIPAALWAALALKFDSSNPCCRPHLRYFLVALVSALLFFSMLGLYRAVIRFVGPKAMLTVLAGVSLSVLVLALFDRFVASHQIPLSAFGIYWALALLYVGGSRFAARYLFQHTGVQWQASRARGDLRRRQRRRARCHRCCSAGADFDPVAFIDDKKSLHGSSINGIRVYGSDVLPKLVRQHRIDRVLLAMPATTRRRRREILAQLEPLGRARAVAAQPVRPHRGQGADQRVARRRRRVTCWAAIRCRPSRSCSARAFAASACWSPGPAARSARSCAGRSSGWRRAGWCCSRCRRSRSTTSSASSRRSRARRTYRRSRSCRCSAMRTTAIACARCCQRSRCRPSITRPPTSTCRSSSTTWSRASTTTSSAPGTRPRRRSRPASRPSC